MKPASLSEIKKEIALLDPGDLVTLCLRIAKYKKDNKELLSYLLFESHDEINFIAGIKAEVDILFTEINYSNIYYVKKGVRKVLRYLNKNIRYSGIPATQAELLIYFCQKINLTEIDLSNSVALHNIYLSQIKKIKKTIESMHEDLQYDFKKELLALS